MNSTYKMFMCRLMYIYICIYNVSLYCIYIYVYVYYIFVYVYHIYMYIIYICILDMYICTYIGLYSMCRLHGYETVPSSDICNKRYIV